MNKLRSVFCAIIFSVLLIVLSITASAQASRTWVSGVGDDANPCSRTAPCKTFAGTISKTAANGEINCLDPGGFGAVTITKSITIDCSATLGGILASGASGVIINAVTTGVVRLRGLLINGFSTGANGVRVVNADRVYIENCVIDGFTTNGIWVENDLQDTQVFVDNTTIRNVITSAPAGIGINMGPDGSPTATLTVTNSRISGTLTAIQVVQSDNSVTNCILSGNDTAISATGIGIVRISGNTISYNATAFTTIGRGAIISYGNNAISGNTANETPTSTTGLK
jgi:hypothetical protein